MTETKKKYDLYFKVPGKVILSGEHSVIRGYEALVFPLKSKYLEFSYFKNSSPLTIESTGTSASDLQLIIWSVIQKILTESKIDRSKLVGHLHIHSEMIFGAGMGGSASLSVGLARLLKFLDLLNEDLFTFSKKVEDLFHGESSGLDVAVVLNEAPLLYKRHHPFQVLKSYELPHLYMSHTGLRGVTIDCVNKVKGLFNTDPEFAKSLDERMQASVTLMKTQLGYKDHLNEWAQSLNLAQSCFEDWGLVPLEAKNHIEMLKREGAIACKMTGSGGGGFVISLWPNKIDYKKLNMIPIESESL